MKLNREAVQIVELAFIAIWAAAFLAINFSNILGVIYGLFIVGFALSAIFDKKISFPVSKQGGWITAIILGIGVYVGFTVLSSLLLTWLSGTSVSFFTSMKIFGSSIPALAESQFTSFIAYAIFIPIVETVAFIRFFEWASDKLNASYKGLELKWIFIMILTSILFMVFHLTSKGVSNFFALLLVALMMAVSIGVTLITKDMKAAILFHIFANGIALMVRAGLLSIS